MASPQSKVLPSMAKPPVRTRPAGFTFLSDGFVFVGGAMTALLVFFTFWAFFNPNPNPNPTTTNLSRSFTTDRDAPLVTSYDSQGFDLRHDPDDPTFYDDPNLSYSIQNHPIRNWDDKRKHWLKLHPSFLAGADERVLLITGSQSSPCRNPIGDHLLLRLFKNKVDYSRLHGYDIFYNNALFHPKMTSYWAKIPAIRAAMVAHPEAEWIWWVDSDAAFTDMDFKLPLHRYRDHDFVIHGWPREIYENKSWVGINAGVFLIRNSQWSMDFMDVWANMGPQSLDYEKWGQILMATLKDKTFPDSDDQGALLYLMLKEKETWGKKIHVETEFYFEGYWLEIVGTLDNITERYVALERSTSKLRRRHAEKVSEKYGLDRDKYLKEAGIGWRSGQRPFITHFAGCQPCSGKHNQKFAGERCWDGMQRALNFADNQVLRSFGFLHPNVRDNSPLSPLPFNYPA